MRRRAIIGAAALVTACLDQQTAFAPPAAPAMEASSVEANPHNALSALVSVRVRDADSVAVRFHVGDGDHSSDSVTPAVAVVGDMAAIPVLGLLPERRYVLRAVAYGPGGSIVADPLEFTTDPLPPGLPRYTAGGPDPAPGYVVFAAGRYGLVIDNTGRVVWYHEFPSGPGLSFMAQPAGGYTARPPTPDPRDLEPWVEIDPLGTVTRTFSCVGGLQPRLHDLIAEPDGSYWIMCDETHAMDLTEVGGLADARVTGTAVQHVAATGALLFQWSPFDHFEITDLDPADRTGGSVNWTHGNALDLDADGNLILSSRSLGEITKIDATTGAVLWRLGGRRNQFTFAGNPAPGFARQHGARAYAPGSLLLLDNLGDPFESRAERYVVDEVTRTAHLVQSYGSLPSVVTDIGGSVQHLPGGRALVSFGTAGRVEEYDASGRVTWRIEGNAGYVFRAQRIQSLYTPGVGSTR